MDITDILVLLGVVCGLLAAWLGGWLAGGLATRFTPNPLARVVVALLGGGLLGGTTGAVTGALAFAGFSLLADGYVGHVLLAMGLAYGGAIGFVGGFIYAPFRVVQRPKQGELVHPDPGGSHPQLESPSGRKV